MAAVYASTLMLPLMPFGELACLMLLGAHERMSAQRAFGIGLVSEVVPAGKHPAGHGRPTRRPQIASKTHPSAVQTSVRTLWAARELSRQQMLGVGNAFLAVGTRLGRARRRAKLPSPADPASLPAVR